MKKSKKKLKKIRKKSTGHKKSPKRRAKPKKKLRKTAGEKTKKAVLKPAKSAKEKKPDKKEKIDDQNLSELIARGRSRGFVTDTEVLHYFPKIEDNVSFLEEIYDRLEAA